MLQPRKPNGGSGGNPAPGNWRASRIGYASVVIILVICATVWRRAVVTREASGPAAAVGADSPLADYQRMFELVAREESAKASSYIKPTATFEMGDTGGKYFGQSPDPAKTRHYYIAAEPDQWDFLPAGSDPICGMPLPPDVIMRHLVPKVRYFQYTDSTFTKRVPQAARLGILGPVLRGVVGEYLAVTFFNRTMDGVFSMHPHGVKYDKDSEGSYHSDKLQALATNGARADSPLQGRGAAVGCNARFTYVWYLDEASGPLPSEPSSKPWLYHSHVTSETEVNLGLEGFIIVTDPNRARPDGTPNDVDREMAALFMIYDESRLGREARERLVTATGGAQAADWVNFLRLEELGQRPAINGYIYGNLPGLEMNEGERVRWYLFGLGSERDLHTAHWHGLRVIEEGRRRADTVELLPATMKVADMLAENPGSWLFHCHVEEHMAEGMFARVTVHPRGGVSVSRDPGQAFFGFPPPTPDPK